MNNSKELEVVPVATDSETDFNLQSALYSLDDSDLVALPTGVSASIREMTGNEQRNFMNRTKQLNGTAIQELLGACTETYADQPVSTDPVVRTKFFLDMMSGDRYTLVFHIRRHSLGDEFRFGAKCPNPECRHEASWEVDLSVKEDFPLKPYMYGALKVIEYNSTCREGLKVQYTHMDGNAEMVMLRKRNTANSLTDLELRNPQAWDGKRWVPISLNRIPDKLITELRQEIKKTEGGIRTTVDVICEKCENEVSFDLLQQQDFMIPSATS